MRSPLNLPGWTNTTFQWPFPGILSNTFGLSLLFICGQTRRSGIHGNTVSFGFEATTSTRRPGSTNETLSFITMISNLGGCKWIKFTMVPLRVFSFPYVLPPIKDVNNYNPNWHILVRSWSSPALNFFKNSLFHSHSNSSKYRHWGDRRKGLYSLTGCPYQAGGIYKNAKALFPSWDKANCRSVIMRRARWGRILKLLSGCL